VAEYLWVIPVKGESERCPGKNTRPTGPDDLPMFLHTVREALLLSGHVVVATDETEVGETSWRTNVAEVLFRPPHLSESSVSAVDVVLWVMDKLDTPEDDEHAVGMLLPTSPLRTAETIRRCMELWERDPCASVATVRGAHREALRYANSSNWLAPLRPPGGAADPYLIGWPRPPKCYVSTGGCQIASARTLRAQGRYWVPKTRPVVVDALEGLDVDTEADWQLADAWLRRRAA